MSALTPADVQREALAWLDVPYAHQGRVRAGVDCVGLVVVVARALGVIAPDFDYTRYGRSPTGALDAILDQHLLPLPAPQPGAVVSIRWWQAAHHLAIVGEQQGRLTLIHSHQSNARVVEHGLAGRWLTRIVGCYGFPGVDYPRAEGAA